GGVRASCSAVRAAPGGVRASRCAVHAARGGVRASRGGVRASRCAERAARCGVRAARGNAGPAMVNVANVTAPSAPSASPAPAPASAPPDAGPGAAGDARPWIAFAACGAIWGSTFLVISVGNDTLAPVWAATLRLVLAALLLGAWTLARGRSLPRGAA